MIHYTVTSLHYVHCYASNEWSDPDKSMHEWGAQRMKGALLDLHWRRWRLQRAASTVQCEQLSPWESRNKAWAALQRVSRTQRGITFSQGMRGVLCQKGPFLHDPLPPVSSPLLCRGYHLISKVLPRPPDVIMLKAWLPVCGTTGKRGDL